MSSVEAKKIVVHEPALGPGWHETIGLLIENMDDAAESQLLPAAERAAQTVLEAIQRRKRDL